MHPVTSRALNQRCVNLTLKSNRTDFSREETTGFTAWVAATIPSGWNNSALANYDTLMLLAPLLITDSFSLSLKPTATPICTKYKFTYILYPASRKAAFAGDANLQIWERSVPQTNSVKENAAADCVCSATTLPGSFWWTRSPQQVAHRFHGLCNPVHGCPPLHSSTSFSLPDMIMGFRSWNCHTLR